MSDLLTAAEARDLADRLYEAWNEGGAEALANDFYDPDVVIYDDPSLPDARVVRGRESVVTHLNSLFDGFGDFKFKVLEVLPFRGGALAEVRIESTGPSSGLPIETVIYHVRRLRSGRFVEVRAFRERNDALAAADLMARG